MRFMKSIHINKIILIHHDFDLTPKIPLDYKNKGTPITTPKRFYVRANLPLEVAIN